MTSRMERDSMGELAVDADRLWGAQTQRSLHYFAISTERMPAELIHALALVKQCCARFTRAQHCLTSASARMSSAGMRSVEIAK